MSDLAATLPFDQDAYRVALPTFEGPLDLLLHLIQKHELNILEVSIAFIAERYLEYLALMQTLNLDIAAEYLLMAATLAHLKSRELLPASPPEESAPDPDAEAEEDPRVSLVKRLLEYQKFKAAAQSLSARSVAGRDVFPRGAELVTGASSIAPLEPVSLFSLMEALQRVAARKKLAFAHEVTADRISISERITQLIDQLQIRKSATFEDLFTADRSIGELVITFLALLEMTRLKITRLYQASPLDMIHIALVARPPEDVPFTANHGS